MRRTVRVTSATLPEERLGRAIAQLPPSARRALAEVADREDLPLVAGSWEDGSGGCLVANVLRAAPRAGLADDRTLDLRVLDLLPELSSRDLNLLIVAWDEASEQELGRRGTTLSTRRAADAEGRVGDPALRRLLRGALARAGVASPGADLVPGPSPATAGAASPA